MNYAALDESIAFLNGTTNTINISSIFESYITEAQNEVLLFIESGIILEDKASLGARVKELISRVIEFIKKVFVKIKTFFERVSRKIKASIADKMAAKASELMKKSGKSDLIIMNSKFAFYSDIAIRAMKTEEEFFSSFDTLEKMINETLTKISTNITQSKNISSTFDDVDKELDELKSTISKLKEESKKPEEKDIGFREFAKQDIVNGNYFKNADKRCTDSFKVFEGRCKKLIDQANHLDKIIYKHGKDEAAGEYGVNLVSRTMNATTRFMSLYSQTIAIFFDMEMKSIGEIYFALDYTMKHLERKK